MSEKKNFSIGLQKINQEYLDLKASLNEVAKTENLIENLASQYGLDSKGNTFEEYEILVNSELSEFNKSNKAMMFLKYMLILFEAFSGYLAIGLVFHVIKIDDVFGEIGSFTFKLLLAILLSFGFIHLAMVQVKRNLVIAIILIIIFPLVNLSVVYLSGIEIEFKQSYLISSFITLTAGLCLLLIAKNEFKKEQTLRILNEISKNLKNRKSFFEKSRKHFSKIPKINNEDNGFLDDIENIPNDNVLYKELKTFLLGCEDFEEWCFRQIDDIKTRLKSRNLNKK